jgi:hypothetical protein
MLRFGGNQYDRGRSAARTHAGPSTAKLAASRWTSPRAGTGRAKWVVYPAGFRWARRVGGRGRPVILIEFDFEGETVRRLGMPEVHGHGEPR